MNLIFVIIIGLTSFLAGGFIAYFVWQKVLKKRNENIIQDAKSEADVIKKEKILQAKEKFFELKSEYEKYIQEKLKLHLRVEK